MGMGEEFREGMEPRALASWRGEEPGLWGL